MFKTPDVMSQVVDMCCEEVDEHGGVSPETLIAANKLIGKFVKYDEIIKIEFDTVAQTAKVIQ
jgi:hypothetical protein